MKRLFWVAVGAGTGVWATRKVTRIARQWTPQSIAGRATSRAVGAGDRIRTFAEDVRVEMHSREEQLREAIELDQAPPGPPAVSAPRRILKARYTIIDEDKDGH